MAYDGRYVPPYQAASQERQERMSQAQNIPNLYPPPQNSSRVYSGQVAQHYGAPPPQYSAYPARQVQRPQSVQSANAFQQARSNQVQPNYYIPNTQHSEQGSARQSYPSDSIQCQQQYHPYPVPHQASNSAYSPYPRGSQGGPYQVLSQDHLRHQQSQQAPYLQATGAATELSQGQQSRQYQERLASVPSPYPSRQQLEQSRKQVAHPNPPAPRILPQPALQVMPRQHTTAYVQIPIQPAAKVSDDFDMPREQKRRRSNEGVAIAVCEVPVPRRLTPQQRTKQPPVASSPLTELASSQMPPTPSPNVDYLDVLLSLADEYVNAAYSMSTSVAASGEDNRELDEDQLGEYYALLTTGIGCLESALNNCRHPDPRKEAHIRLRLATLLFSETEDTQFAEDVLSKGIGICDRNRLSDAKYAMHHLLARVTAKKSMKAALKSIDKVVLELEALKITHWIYSFRLLHVSLALQTGQQTQTAALLKHLSAVSTMADDQRHIAIHITAATLEAVVHVQSGAAESVENAQRALAVVRTYQLGPEFRSLGPMRALLACLDLACTLLSFDANTIEAKLQLMHDSMDDHKGTVWSKDGHFTVPLGVEAGVHLEADTASVFSKSTSSEACLRFQWLTKAQLYTLGYLLSGFAMMHKNSLDGKAQIYLGEGPKLSRLPLDSLAQPLSISLARLQWQASIGIQYQLQQAFAHCGRSEWRAASLVVNEVQQQLELQEAVDDDIDVARLALVKALIQHGTGDLEAALQLYELPVLALRLATKQMKVLREIQVIAALNNILILRALRRHGDADNLLESIEDYCKAHADKSILSAYYIVRSATQADTAIIKTKQYLQQAVQAAKAASNHQLLCIIMNNMRDLFFANIVGEQAEKSAKAGRSLASKTSNDLWLAVADGMLAETMELSGKFADAQRYKDEGMAAMERLPQSLRERLAANANGDCADYVKTEH